MSGFNKWIAIGNLTKDPELRYTSNGKAVCNFTIAVNRKYQQTNEVLFMPCVAFDKQAENLAQYMKKGNQILIEGELKERKWEKDGVEHKKIEVHTHNIRYISKPGETAAGQPDEFDGGY